MWRAKLVVTITDLPASVAGRKQMAVNHGVNIFSIDVAGLNAGVYLLHGCAGNNQDAGRPNSAGIKAYAGNGIHTFPEQKATLQWPFH